MIRSRILLAVFAVLIAAAPALAAAPPWTAAGTTVVIDESSVPLAALTPPFFGFAPGVGNGVITGYLNVTDTTATALPGWNYLELSAFDNSPQSQVSATLFQLDKCTGAVTAICQAVSTDAAVTKCSRCALNAQLDFNLYDYYVTVNVYRSSTALAPKFYAVRLIEN